jgi:hypothetical protein
MKIEFGRAIHSVFFLICSHLFLAVLAGKTSSFLQTDSIFHSIAKNARLQIVPQESF